MKYSYLVLTFLFLFSNLNADSSSTSGNNSPAISGDNNTIIYRELNKNKSSYDTAEPSDPEEKLTYLINKKGQTQSDLSLLKSAHDKVIKSYNNLIITYINNKAYMNQDKIYEHENLINEMRAHINDLITVIKIEEKKLLKLTEEIDILKKDLGY